MSSVPGIVLTKIKIIVELERLTSLEGKGTSFSFIKVFFVLKLDECIATNFFFSLITHSSGYKIFNIWPNPRKLAQPNHEGTSKINEV